MNKAIDPAVQERIRSFCRQVTVAYDLDAEIQEELYGHMEDKLLAYMAGEEKMSEEDAFILVREHFGSAEVVKELLQAAHEPGEEESGLRVSLPRRLTTVWVLTVATVLFSNIIIRYEGIFKSVPISALMCLAIAVYGAGVAVLWKVLLGWQRRLNRGERLWFARCHPGWMWAIALATLATPLCLPYSTLAVDYGKTVAEYTLNPGPVGVSALLFTVLGLQLLQQCAWFWWTDRPPRRGSARSRTFLCVVMFNLYVTLLSRWNPMIRITGSGENPTALTPGTRPDWNAVQQWWSANHHEAPMQLLISASMQFASTVFIVLLAYGVYLLVRHNRRPTTKGRTSDQAVA